MNETKQRRTRRGLRARFDTEWNELEALLSQAEAAGLSGLSVVQVRRVVRLYRRAVSSMALAREQAVDPPLVEYLEQLVARAHVALHGTTRPSRRSLRRFVGAQVPRAVRRIAGQLATSAVAVALGVLLGCVLTANDPAWFFAFVDDALRLGHSPAEQTSVLAAGLDAAFAHAVFSRVVLVSLLALAMGLAGGAPGLIVLFAGGTMGGALGTLLIGRGLGYSTAASLAPYAAPTLLACLLFGAVGISLGRALVRPGRDGMLAELQSAARNGAVVLVAATALLVVGLASRAIADAFDLPGWVRLAVGWAHITWIAMWLFPLSRKERRS